VVSLVNRVKAVKVVSLVSLVQAVKMVSLVNLVKAVKVVSRVNLLEVVKVVNLVNLLKAVKAVNLVNLANPAKLALRMLQCLLWPLLEVALMILFPVVVAIQPAVQRIAELVQHLLVATHLTVRLAVELAADHRTAQLVVVVVELAPLRAMTLSNHLDKACSLKASRSSATSLWWTSSIIISCKNGSCFKIKRIKRCY
jgi:hypothetical protein